MDVMIAEYPLLQWQAYYRYIVKLRILIKLCYCLDMVTYNVGEKHTQVIRTGVSAFIIL